MELNRESIDQVVRDFYTKAVNDIIIGYHFRHIQNFDTHIPRIVDFWELQLTGKTVHPKSLPFNLLQVHAPLKFTSGQLDRWVLLFLETLTHSKIGISAKQAWEEKVQHFQQIFCKSAHFFKA